MMNILEKITPDTNGNPRYVTHFLNFLSKAEQDQFKGIKAVQKQYDLAVEKARKIGGRKFNTKSFGGGIVIQSFNPQKTESQILALRGPE